MEGMERAVDALGQRFDLRVIFLLLWKHHLVSLLQSGFFSSPPCSEVLQKGQGDGFAILPSLKSRLGGDSGELQGLGVVAREAVPGGDSWDGAPWEWGCTPSLSSPAVSAAASCLLGCQGNTAGFGSSPESSWGFWHLGSS